MVIYPQISGQFHKMDVISVPQNLQDISPDGICQDAQGTIDVQYFQPLFECDRLKKWTPMVRHFDL